MSQGLELRREIPIDSDFFCDGPFYLLTSVSLGGSHLSAEEIADTLGRGDKAEVENLLQQGICLPLFFNADCALDNSTLFVLGDLTAQEENDWIARIVSKLNIPCGKLILFCGGGVAEELAEALAGDPVESSSQFFQAIEVLPGEYQVEIYAYLASVTVQLSLDEYDENCNLIENEPLKQWYRANRPGTPNIKYIIRLTPLEAEPPLPKLTAEIGWCGEFEFRETPHFTTPPPTPYLP